MTDKDPTSESSKIRIPDPQNAPTGEIRKLMQGVFNPKSLSRFCEEHPIFRAIRHSFPSGGSLDDMIDVVFDFCRTRDRWEDLLDGIAKLSPSIYNRTASWMGWPLVEDPEEVEGTVAPPGPATPLAPQPTPPPMYDDIEIHVTSGPDDQYQVTIHTELAGDASDLLDKRWTDAELAQWLARLEQGQTDIETLETIGKQLFLALLHDHVRDSYAEARGATQAGLRLRLRLDPPELQTLPWELLWDAGPRHEFLALSGKVLITRYLEAPHKIEALRVTPPLRLLIVTASPSDQPLLDVDAEEAAIRTALTPLVAAGLLRVESRPHAQVMALRQALLNQRPHILHVVGHGALGPEGGALLLEDADGLTRPLLADDLRLLLQYAPTVRLAVLNACQTARGAADLVRFDAQRRAVLGVGPALVQAGLGAVVALQFSLGDLSARLFAQDFYASLARLEPVDLAVARAREALRLELGASSRDWATPVLFLRAPDGVIFQAP